MTDCKGDWRIGTACGKCSRCSEAARKLIPTLLADNNSMREILDGLHEELTTHKRMVSNPRLVALGIASVIHKPGYNDDQTSN